MSAGPAPARLAAEDWLVLGPVLALPWAFGGVPLWAFRSAALSIACAAALVVLRHGFSGLGVERGSRWLLPAWLLAAWAALQLVPLPPPAVAVLSPRADAIFRETFPGYPGAAPPDLVRAIEQSALERAVEFAGLAEPSRAEDVALGEPAGRWAGWRALSLLPDAGVERLSWYLALLLAFVIVRRRCADPALARTYRAALFALFVGLAVFGLVHGATSDGRLYWLHRTIEPTRPFGPYVTATHFAGVMELAVPWLAGAALAAWRHARREGLRGSRAPLRAAATGLGLHAGVATASKGALPLLAGGLALLAVLEVRSARQRAGVLLVFALLGGLAWVGARQLPVGQRVQEFLEQSRSGVGEIDRLVGWSVGLRMLGDYPRAGCGFGAFRDVFPAYLPAGEQLRWEQMHNDYLEVAIEGGFVAVALVGWLGWGFLRRVGRLVRHERRRRDPAAVGLAIGLLALAIHAAFDFNHQVPANALLFVALGALAVTASERAPRTAEETA